MDIDALRKETPGCRNVVHLNNAGAALMPEPVLAAQIDHLRRESEIGGYEAKAEALPRIEAVYDSLARLINAKRDEIALLENATVAWVAAFNAVPFSPGDRLVTGEAEYASNYLNFLRAKERLGIEILVAPSAPTGQIDVEALEGLLDERVKLIAITHVPTNGGLINPAAEVGRLARKHGILFLLDACQSAGQLHLDVEAIGCDLLSATGRKFLRGPRGTGFLYVRQAVLDRLVPLNIDLHSARWLDAERYELLPTARRFENWEFNEAAVLGLGAAVDYALALGTQAIEQRITWLGKRLRFILRDHVKLAVHDIGAEQCGIVTFTVPDRSASEVQRDLRALDINVSVADPVGALLDAKRRKLQDMIRASVHYYNTEEDDFSKLTRALWDTRRQ
ncbi:MAG: aminotransferase class V-fold PLP-dependent enzyme [Rhodospirillales bacterium]